MTCTNFLEHLTLMWFAIDQLGTKNTWRGKVQVTGSQISILEGENPHAPIPDGNILTLGSAASSRKFHDEKKGIKAMLKVFVSWLGEASTRYNFIEAGNVAMHQLQENNTENWREPGCIRPDAGAQLFRMLWLIPYPNQSERNSWGCYDKQPVAISKCARKSRSQNT